MPMGWVTSYLFCGLIYPWHGTLYDSLRRALVILHCLASLDSVQHTLQDTINCHLPGNFPPLLKAEGLLLYSVSTSLMKFSIMYYNYLSASRSFLQDWKLLEVVIDLQPGSIVLEHIPENELRPKQITDILGCIKTVAFYLGGIYFLLESATERTSSNLSPTSGPDSVLNHLTLLFELC